MITIQASNGKRYTCVRHNHQHRWPNGETVPCMACAPVPVTPKNQGNGK